MLPGKSGASAPGQTQSTTKQQKKRLTDAIHLTPESKGGSCMGQSAWCKEFICEQVDDMGLCKLGDAKDTERQQGNPLPIQQLLAGFLMPCSARIKGIKKRSSNSTMGSNSVGDAAPPFASYVSACAVVKLRRHFYPYVVSSSPFQNRTL